jgi:hypothetical protein
MKINETLEQEIATRLGITRPNCPKDVAEYMADTEAYTSALSDYTAPRMGWRMTTDQAKAQIEETRLSLTNLESIISKLESHSETTALAFQAYYRALGIYEQAIETERSRPRNEFEIAKRLFVETLEKERRSLKRKTTVNQNKRWETKADSEERKAIEQTIAEQSERLETIGYLIQETNYISYNEEEPTVFTEQTLWDNLGANEYKMEQILNTLATFAGIN